MPVVAPETYHLVLIAEVKEADHAGLRRWGGLLTYHTAVISALDNTSIGIRIKRLQQGISLREDPVPVLLLLVVAPEDLKTAHAAHEEDDHQELEAHVEEDVDEAGRDIRAE